MLQPPLQAAMLGPARCLGAQDTLIDQLIDQPMDSCKKGPGPWRARDGIRAAAVAGPMATSLLEADWQNAHVVPHQMHYEIWEYC